MAKKKNTAQDSDNIETKDEFEETPVSDLEDVEEVPDADEAQDQLAELSEMLANPDKALGIKADESEETEEVLYCPNCGVTGLFVDNVCMNCGEKKSKKSFSNDEAQDDLMDFGGDESINIDEF